MQPIIDAYATMTQQTLQAWSAHPGIGAQQPAYPYKHQLGVSSGHPFAPSGVLKQLYDELCQLAATDPLYDVVPAHGLHFTFLALAWDRFNSIGEVPPEINELVPLFKETVAGLSFTVTDLRLVPLKNALLLAGLPDAQTYAVRQRLAQRVLQSSWRPHLEARYAGFPIPPLIWHITLVRYAAEYAPQPLRDLYQCYRTASFGSLELGEPQIGVINYNWTKKNFL
ncbi:MAG: hypothetical protein U0175_26530 [Caldilineaceae bacterium]